MKTILQLKSRIQQSTVLFNYSIAVDGIQIFDLYTLFFWGKYVFASEK